ncbi:hypothetical protein VO54_01743 [Elizabethkingia miricola]|nr:hypothetical protein VO54_01743 [Elizabethkingia miricola]
MLQLILMLLGLAFPNNNTPAPVNHPTTISTYSMDSGDPGDTVADTGGDNGQTPPPKI